MRRLIGWLAVWVWLIGLPGGPAAEAAKPARKAKPPVVVPLKVGLFDAMKAKQVTTSFVPRDAEVAWLTLVNISNKPLEVGLPSAFAGAPVVALAQLQPGAPYLSADSESSVPQILGSVIPTTLASAATRSRAVQPPAAPSSAAQSSAATVVLQPRQMKQFAVSCVCLQYGNPTPRPEVPYKLVALDSVSRSPQLRVLLDEFSLGRLDQPVVQLAAWHFSNNLSWDQLGETGFAPGRLGEAQGLAALIESDVSRKRASAASESAGQATSPGSQAQKPTNNPTSPGE